MKKTINTTLKSLGALALVAAVSIGCSRDFLTTTPVGRDLEVNYYQTEEQAFEALVAVYDVLQWNDQFGLPVPSRCKIPAAATL